MNLVVSSDDDMRPYALMEDSPESLEIEEVCRGRLHKAGNGHHVRKSFDILAAFKDVLGKSTYSKRRKTTSGANLLIDTGTHLETNATKGLTQENSLMLGTGDRCQMHDIIKIAQTFRSGTNDIDAIDFVEMFLADEKQVESRRH